MDPKDNPATPQTSVGEAAEAAKPTTTATDDIPEGMQPPVLDDQNLPKPPKLKKSPKKALLVVVIIAVILAVAGAAGWFFILRPEAKPAPTPQTNQSTQDDQTSSNDVPDAANTETLTNDVYRITLMYPKTWTATDEDDGSILIQSQDFTYQTAAGEDKRGNFRVAIRKGATTADSEIIAKGVAIAPSEKLVYTNPAPGQRTETNLSSFGKDKEDNFAFILITSNFTLQKGDTLGPNFGKETDAFLIGGGYSESSLTPGMATNSVPIEGYNTTNAYKQAVAIIQSLEIK